MTQTTYERILLAAYDYFAENGYEKASMSEIAKLVGISKPALYHHFESKEVLFETLYAQIILLIEADFETDFSILTRDTFFEKVTEVGLSDLRALQAQPQLTKILRQYELLALRSPVIAQMTHALESKTYAYHHRLMRQGVHLGIIPENELEQAASLFYTFLSGLTWNHIRGINTDIEEIWTLGITRLLKGSF